MHCPFCKTHRYVEEVEHRLRQLIAHAHDTNILFAVQEYPRVDLIEVKPEKTARDRPTNVEDVAPAGQQLLRMKQVCRMVGLSHMTVYRLMRQGKFPQQLSLTARRVAWDRSQIEQWIASRRQV
jgi:prophage regulatory protein